MSVRQRLQQNESGIELVMTRTPNEVTIYEVGPRDGLQNEATPVPTAAKLQFIADLRAAGLRWIEATSFVPPSVVPQLADAADLLAGIDAVDPEPGGRYPVLVPNEKGMLRALDAGCDAVAVFAAATEVFSQANIRATIDESFVRFQPIARMAAEQEVWLRGYVSVAFHCPYSGVVDPQAAIDVALRLLDLGCDEVAIADTIGRATPREVDAFLHLATAQLPFERLAFHLHDTSGLALTNVKLALEAGISVFDGAAGGLGGCPFAPGAPGNLATEQLVAMLEGMGIRTGVDAAAVAAAGRTIRSLLTAAPTT